MQSIKTRLAKCFLSGGSSIAVIGAMLSTFLQYLAILFTKSTLFFLNIFLLFFSQKYDEAANAFYEGVTLAPENGELIQAFRFVNTHFLICFFLIFFQYAG